MRITSALAVALTAVAALPLLAGPAQAVGKTCPATFSGGLVGALSISSSHSLFAYGVAHEDKVAIDRVQVDPYSGLTKYRLAEDVNLINWRTNEPFIGGTGHWFTARVGEEVKDKCVAKKLGGVRGPYDLF
jgi:hypothetical protein